MLSKKFLRNGSTAYKLRRSWVIVKSIMKMVFIICIENTILYDVYV